MTTTTLNSNGFAEADGTITVYNYSPFTGEYIGSNDVFLSKGVGIPGYSTTIAPSETKTGYAQVFNPSTKEWSYVEDHRGQIVYNIKTSQPFTIIDLGPIDTTLYSVDKPEIVISLKEQATSALASARTYVYNNYGILNEATPDDWVTYIKALMAISNGTDATSTTLPTQPSE